MPSEVKPAVKKTNIDKSVIQEKKKPAASGDNLKVIQQSFNEKVKPILFEARLAEAKLIIEQELIEAGDISYRKPQPVREKEPAPTPAIYEIEQVPNQSPSLMGIILDASLVVMMVCTVAISVKKVFFSGNNSGYRFR